MSSVIIECITVIVTDKHISSHSQLVKFHTQIKMHYHTLERHFCMCTAMWLSKQQYVTYNIFTQCNMSFNLAFSSDFHAPEEYFKISPMLCNAHFIQMQKKR